MRKKYSEPIGSVGIHSGCVTLNDTNDVSIFPSLDISRVSDAFVGAPNCSCTCRGGSWQTGMKIECDVP